MKRKRIRRYSEAARIPKGKTDWRRVDKLTDKDIQKAVAEDPDAPPLWTDEDWAQAEIVMPERKQSVTIRLDQDVVGWFKRQGRGYQTRMNAVLKAYVKAQQSERTSKTAKGSF